MKSKRQRILDALLDSETITAAAQKAGVARATVYNYLGDNGFVRELQSYQRRVLLTRADDLAELRRGALDVVKSIMTDTENKPEVRLQAARTILNVVNGAELAAAGALAVFETESDPIKSFY